MFTSKAALAVALTSWLAWGSTPWGSAARAAELRTVLAGRIDRVVAAGSGVAVLRGGEAVLVDGEGRVVGRCGTTAAPFVAPPRDGTALDAEEVLRLADLSEDDVSPEAEELLDDEGVDERPRHRVDPQAVAPARALSLAGTADAAWIGTTDGLVRVDARTGACARTALGGRALDVVAVAGRALVAVADTVVWRSDDGGASFHVATVLTSPARAAAVAITEDGTLAFVADAEGVVELLGGSAARRVLERPTGALVACGAEVLALAGGGVYRLARDADVEELGARPPTRALACSEVGEPRVVAAGLGLWSSHDGRAWNEDGEGVGASFSDVALTATGVWLATDDGLRGPALPDLDLSDADLGVEALPRPPRSAPPRELPRWSAVLPRLTIAFASWSDSRGRAGWRCWAVLTFSLDRRAHARMNALSEVSP